VHRAARGQLELGELALAGAGVLGAVVDEPEDVVDDESEDVEVDDVDAPDEPFESDELEPLPELFDELEPLRLSVL
jgi:hypothetical protein